LKIAKLKCS